VVGRRAAAATTFQPFITYPSVRVRRPDGRPIPESRKRVFPRLQSPVTTLPSDEPARRRSDRPSLRIRHCQDTASDISLGRRSAMSTAAQTNLCRQVENGLTRRTQGGEDRNVAAAQPVQPNMRYPRDKSTDVGQVVQALSNGLRSEVEIAKTARLLLDRVQNALAFLVAQGCVVQSAGTLFRLTDSGNDMVKEANAAERNHRALCAGSAVMYAAGQTTIVRNLPS
jgi:hypothetical protein